LPALFLVSQKATSIAFVFCSPNYFSPFFAQKSHVKPPNHLTLASSTTSAWHFSYIQPAIIEIGIKEALATAGVLSFKQRENKQRRKEREERRAQPLCLEEFGRKPFEMKILQAPVIRKPLDRLGLRAGSREGGTA
jgi:hypothetical protein